MDADTKAPEEHPENYPVDEWVRDIILRDWWGAIPDFVTNVLQWIEC